MYVKGFAFQIIASFRIIKGYYKKMIFYLWFFQYYIQSVGVKILLMITAVLNFSHVE